jgi:hypothetical protein
MEKTTRKNDSTRVYTKTGCEQGNYIELAQNHVQLWDLVLMVLNIHILTPEI